MPSPMRTLGRCWIVNTTLSRRLLFTGMQNKKIPPIINSKEYKITIPVQTRFLVRIIKILQYILHLRGRQDTQERHRFCHCLLGLFLEG